MAANVVIKELLDNPFTVLQLSDKLRTVNKCRPAPPLPNFINIKLRHNYKQYTFRSHKNEMVCGLGGCKTTNKIYC